MQSSQANHANRSAVYALSLNEKEQLEIDTSSYVSIHENENNDCFKVFPIKESEITDEDYMSNLTDAVLEKIQEDIANGDLTAIDELLQFIPRENLIGYLPEEGV